MRSKSFGFALACVFMGGAVAAQEGFILQDKPSAQCSIHLCEEINGPSYAKDGSIIRPIGWESWIFVGSPVTPNALNGGKASFQESHNVYIEPSAFEHYKITGEFPNGTQIIKVRTHLYNGDDCFEVDEDTGACSTYSGWGYFNGEYSGFELTVKDTTRFDDPGGWVYLNFGETLPWQPTANPFDATSCNSCHEANAADDFVFTQFYPVLRNNDPKLKQKAMPAAAGGDKAEADTTKQLPAVMSPVPVDDAALFKYLQEGGYKSFKVSEAKPHHSAGPHIDFGKPVKVFFSDGLSASIEGSYDAHPKGAAAVKELYNDAGDEVIGWAVAVKTEEDSAKGEGWYWVEYTSASDMSQKYVPAGNGVSTCTGCHSGGNDFILSSLPE